MLQLAVTPSRAAQQVILSPIYRWRAFKKIFFFKYIKAKKIILCSHKPLASLGI